MGASYLSRPKKDKESEDKQNKKLAYGVSSMQGWRLQQEDAHNCILDYDEGTALFGIYDGHGGAEVAIYTSEKLPGFIKDNEEYKNGNYEQALISAFLEFDGTLTSKEAAARLNEIIQSDKKDKSEERTESSTLSVFPERAHCSHSSKNGDGDDDDDADDVDYEYADVDPETETPDSLRRDASRPLEEVIASYRIPNVDKLIAGASGIKPTSPYLRGRRDGAGSSGECSTSSAGECSSSFVKPGPSSSNGCTSSASSNKIEKTEVNGTGDAEAESSVNGEPEAGSSKSIVEEQSEEISKSSKTSKEEASQNDSGEPLVNGSANVNGDITEEAEASTKETPTKSSSKSEEEPSCSPLSKKKKLALTDLDDSDLVKNFITNEEIDENDEDDSEDETFEVEEGGESDSDEESFGYSESPLSKLKRRLCQVAMQAEALDDDEDDDDDDDDDDDENYNGSSKIASIFNLGDAEGDDDEEEEEEEEEEEDEDEDEDEEGEEEEDIEVESFLGSNNPGFESGCTAVVALIKDDTLYVANAGDSRCILCKDGTAVYMSKDHKPENELERSRIEKAGGHVSSDGRVNGGLNLSRAIGDFDYKRNEKLSNKEQMIVALPDVRICKLDPEIEFIVLACDGIWDSMTSQAVVDFVRPKVQSNQKLSTICEELFEACLAPNILDNGTDNMTCIIVKILRDGDNYDKAAVVDDSKQPTDSEKPVVDNSKQPTDSGEVLVEDSKQPTISEKPVVDNSKQPTDSEVLVDDSKQPTISEKAEVDSKIENISEKTGDDSIPTEPLQSADNSQPEKGNNEAVPSQASSEANEPVSEAEKQSDTSTHLKRSADSTEDEEGEKQAKRQKTDTDTDTNVDSS